MNVDWLLLLLAALVTLVVTPLVGILMRRWNVVDRPQANTRKIHQRPTPLGGGLAIFFVFFGGLMLLWQHDEAIKQILTWRAALAFGAGALVMMIGGFWDDKYVLRPRQQIIFPLLAALLVVFGGIGPTALTNPFGGTFNLTVWQFEWLDVTLTLANVVTFVWLMGLMFTTKFLDGLDGLVTGVVGIGAIILYFLTQQPAWFQPELGRVIMLLAGTCLGFLVWNFQPAKIFLGEGGSLLLGFLLGVIAVLAGGKIMTAFLVLGLPAFDVLRVIIRRWQKHRPIFVGDREHLHFQLLAAGLSQRQAVLLLYAIAAIFGVSGLVLQNVHKLLALGALLIVMFLFSAWIIRKEHRSA